MSVGNESVDNLKTELRNSLAQAVSPEPRRVHRPSGALCVLNRKEGCDGLGAEEQFARAGLVTAGPALKNGKEKNEIHSSDHIFISRN